MAVLDTEEKESTEDDGPIVFDREDRALEVAVTHTNGVPEDCRLVRSWTAEMAQRDFPDSIVVGPDRDIGEGWVQMGDGLAQRFAQPSVIIRTAGWGSLLSRSLLRLVAVFHCHEAGLTGCGPFGQVD